VGRKPHTAIELTATGKQAYQNWGEMILAALPEDIQDSLRKRIVHQELDLSRYNLSLKDWDYGLRVGSAYPSTSLKNGGRVPWPPLEEAWIL